MGPEEDHATHQRNVPSNGETHVGPPNAVEVELVTHCEALGVKGVCGKAFGRQDLTVPCLWISAALINGRPTRRRPTRRGVCGAHTSRRTDISKSVAEGCRADPRLVGTKIDMRSSNRSCRKLIHILVLLEKVEREAPFSSNGLAPTSDGPRCQVRGKFRSLGI